MLWYVEERKSAAIRRRELVDCFDEDLDGLIAGMYFDANFCVCKIYFVSATIAAADDGVRQVSGPPWLRDKKATSTRPHAQSTSPFRDLTDTYVYRAGVRVESKDLVGSFAVGICIPIIDSLPGMSLLAIIIAAIDAEPDGCTCANTLKSSRKTSARADIPQRKKTNALTRNCWALRRIRNTLAECLRSGCRGALQLR